MRSLRNACLVAVLAAAGGGLIDTPVQANPPVRADASTQAGTQAEAAAAPPGHEAIQAALARLLEDPNLGTQRTVRSLHWIDAKASSPPAAAPPWIVGLFQFFSQVAGFLMWLAGAIGFAIALVWTLRLIRARRPAATIRRAVPVSHVGDWDIRPDSLPDDVGGAALALLDAGHTRDALSLLYRAALSRAVHRFGVPIQVSFTEGEALRAVAARLDRPRAQYFTDLIGQWQRVVYGGRPAAADPVRNLCTGFSPALDAGDP